MIETNSNNKLSDNHNSHQNKNTESSHPVGSSDKPNRDTNGITGSGDNNYSQFHGKEKQ